MIRRAVQASTALVIRQVLVFGANTLGSVILARLLPPDQFGFYGIVLFAVAFLGIFGGTGFAANLIRTREEPWIYDMRVVFTAQQLMVGVLFFALDSCSFSFVPLPNAGTWKMVLPHDRRRVGDDLIYGHA